MNEISLKVNILRVQDKIHSLIIIIIISRHTMPWRIMYHKQP